MITMIMMILLEKLGWALERIIPAELVTHADNDETNSLAV